ncbi:MAG: hypothetical protein SFX18_12820 [Pirellulales bacterium]|nr:hypothetical protein [Pirellulales bacterium]
MNTQTDIPYPENLTIEIDRDRLRKYLRVKYLFYFTPLLIFGALIGFTSSIKTLERTGEFNFDTLLFVLRCIGTGVGISLLIALSGYFGCVYFYCARYAYTLSLTVEGAFLRIRQHSEIFTDRKLHFRSIVDYTVSQSYFMRLFQIESLQMSTTGRNDNLSIPGVKDCLQVRDMLAEIDSQRENR